MDLALSTLTMVAVRHMAQALAPRHGNLAPERLLLVTRLVPDPELPHMRAAVVVMPFHRDPRPQLGEHQPRLLAQVPATTGDTRREQLQAHSTLPHLGLALPLLLLAQ